tara:strand:- start:132 stop:1205 length:1074 start_codon:yes stop_codon:yes gene_type:complete
MAIDYNTLKQTILSNIVTNNNNEITAAILEPILTEILEFTRQEVGDTGNLQTLSTDLTSAINEILNNISIVFPGNDGKRYVVKDGDWVLASEAFILSNGQTGDIDEDSDLSRVGKTSFGGDDPESQVEVIGDYYNKESIDGIGAVVSSTGNNVARNAGIPAGLLTGVEQLFEEEGTNQRVQFFAGKDNNGSIADLLAIMGINKGANPLIPDDYARFFAFRALEGHLVIDLECKSGGDTNKFRLRSGQTEFSKPMLNNQYGKGNLKEGDNYNCEYLGNIVLGEAAYLAAFDSIGNIIEIPATKISNKPILFGDLPGSPNVGDKAIISDASSVNYAANASGGGSTTIPVFYDGTNWIYA